MLISIKNPRVYESNWDLVKGIEQASGEIVINENIITSMAVESSSRVNIFLNTPIAKTGRIISALSADVSAFTFTSAQSLFGGIPKFSSYEENAAYSQPKKKHTRKHWSEREVDIVKSLYPDISAAFLELSDRTPRALILRVMTLYPEDEQRELAIEDFKKWCSEEGINLSPDAAE